MNAQLWAGDMAVERNGDMTVRLSDRRIIHGHNFEVLGGIFQRCGCRRLFLDLQKVEQLSSSALGRLLALNKVTHAEHGELILVNLNPRLARVFQVSRVELLFKIEEKSYEENEEGAIMCRV